MELKAQTNKRPSQKIHQKAQFKQFTWMQWNGRMSNTP